MVPRKAAPAAREIGGVTWSDHAHKSRDARPANRLQAQCAPSHDRRREVVAVSAQTRQTDLEGRTIRERPPSDPTAATLDRLPSDTAFPAIGAWVQLAEGRDTRQVLAWIDRATAEGVIATAGGKR